MLYALLSVGIYSLTLLSAGFANTIEFDDCVVSFFQNSSNDTFVIKQMKDPSNDEQFLLVIDATACYIAETNQIPMNKVTLIAATTPAPEKIIPGFPATIHTVAPGIRTDEKSPYQNIDIQQRFRKKNSPREKKWGVLSPENTGLTLTVIQEMAKCPDLAKIVALDTFLGNADRSPPNLFYNPSTNQFCGIDMAASFNSDLAKEACRQIQTLLDEHTPITDNVKKALIEYADTLKNLIANYPPQTQEDLLRKFSQEVAERIDYHKKVIKRNYEYSQKLLPLVEKLILS